jgi:endonuclease III
VLLESVEEVRLTLQDPQEQELQEPEQQLQELSELVSRKSSRGVKCSRRLAPRDQARRTYQGDMLIDLGGVEEKTSKVVCELSVGSED